MNIEALEATVKALQDQVQNLQVRVQRQEKEITTLHDIEEIKTLQKAYGYYLEHWMAQEVIDCFADSPEVSLVLYEGTWLRKEGVRKYFDRWKPYNPEYMHQVMQLCGIVTMDPDGQRAKGRWYSFGAVARPIGGGVRQYFMNGIYEMEYIKEGGKWKFLKLQYALHYAAPPDKGWVKPERIAAIDPKAKMEFPVPDIVTTDGLDTKYPSGYIFPFHFKHPVTGKETSEGRINSILKFKKKEFN